jgi:hypothetical protein
MPAPVAQVLLDRRAMNSGYIGRFQTVSMTSFAGMNQSSVLFNRKIGTTALMSANFALATPFNVLKHVWGSIAPKLTCLIVDLVV